MAPRSASEKELLFVRLGVRKITFSLRVPKKYLLLPTHIQGIFEVEVFLVTRGTIHYS
jgi:hypothetical protein